MLFNSIDFLIFFPIVVVVFFVIPDKVKMYWLLATSYYFYMCWNAEYAVLILFSTVATYFSGLLLERVEKKKLIVGMCVILNLAILFFFKYCNFAIDCITSVAEAIGVRLTIPQLDVLLPVGISFYTFQALSYTIDVYRGTISPERNFFKYALFVSFFPQLVAGPIERSENLLHQLEEPKTFEIDRFREGFLLMLWGFFLKLALADRIAIVVDEVYGNIDSYPGLYLAMATGLFAFQIYCDFAGYSTIAKGAAKILGIDLMENFAAPYFAVTVSEFWRRWHISLTSWFKDYVYIPLGGNRKGKVRKWINKLIVFLLSGLWHGANITFVVWGGLNGLYQVFGEMMEPVRARIRSAFRINKGSWIYRLLGIGVTFILVTFAWIFFRASSMSDAMKVIRLMFSEFNPEIIITGKIYCLGVEADNFRMMAVCMLVLIVADGFKLRGVSISKWIMSRKPGARCLITAGSILFILVFGAWGPAFNAANFIYFQF